MPFVPQTCESRVLARGGGYWGSSPGSGRLWGLTSSVLRGLGGSALNLPDLNDLRRKSF